MPLFDRLDTVGPMSKHIDDLALAFTIMSGNNSIYNYAKYTQPGRSAFRIGYNELFFDDFKMYMNDSDDTLYFNVNDEIKKHMNKLISNLNSQFNRTDVQTIRIDFDSSHISKLFSSIHQTYISLYLCGQDQMVSLLHAYFNDSDRFPVDSPYRDVNSFLVSSLLSEKWTSRDIFSKINITRLRSSPNFQSKPCSDLNFLMAQFKRIFYGWFDKHNLDALLLPSAFELPNRHDGSRPDSFVLFCAFSDYPCLNVPVGFSSPNAQNPDGLPIGVTFITRPQRLIDLFRVIRMYEIKFGRGIGDKLPYTTPPLDENSCHLHQLNSAINNQSKRLVLVLVVAIVGVLDFFNIYV